MTDGNKLRYDDSELDEESLKKILEEINESDENKRVCMDILKKKLDDKEDLNPYPSEEFLLSFLRVSKYDCNKAYQRVLKFYEERWNLPEVYNDYIPSTVKIVEAARQMYACPYRLKNNSALAIIKRGAYDPSEIHYDLIIRALSMIGDMVFLQPMNQLCGFTAILDLKSPAWSGWSEYTPTRLKLIARLIQKTSPLKIRAIHVVNAPPIYYIIYSILYPFLSTKMRNRIILHKNYSALHSYIDPEYLPKEYDGCLEQSDLINLFERLYEKEEFFEKFSKYGFVTKKK